MNNFEKYRAWCKATNSEDSSPRYSHNWLLSRRGWFRIFEDRIECGDWRIPLGSVEKAIAYKTKQMFIPVTVLQLITADGSYQFGFNPWATPLDHIGIDIEEQKVKLKYSPFSVMLRVAVVVYLVYWLWSEYGKT